VPAAETTGVVLFAPDTMEGPVQLKIAEVALVEEVKMIWVFEQLITEAGEMVMEGLTVSKVTFTVVLALQPLTGLVTVRVNVPA
jgi:predicted nucleotidyltransferase